MKRSKDINAGDYMLAKACVSSVFQSLMNAYNTRDNERESWRHEKQANFLEDKFKGQFGMHPQAYIDLYEGRN